MHSKSSVKQSELIKTQLRVYQEAKESFDNHPYKSIDATKTARFLRDTAENCISYFQSLENQKTSDYKIDLVQYDDIIQELHRTFERMNKLVEGRCGGKKRVFDQSRTQQGQSSRQSQNANKKIRPGPQDNVNEPPMVKPGSSLTVDHKMREPLDDIHSHQRHVPLNITNYQQRRQDNPTAIGHKRVESSPQSSGFRSHHGKGKRNVLSDRYHPGHT